MKCLNKHTMNNCYSGYTGQCILSSIKCFYRHKLFQNKTILCPTVCVLTHSFQSLQLNCWHFHYYLGHSAILLLTNNRKRLHVQIGVDSSSCTAHSVKWCSYIAHYHHYRRPEDWTLSWNGSGTIYGWGHNHRGQLGGVEGAKVKLPTPCEALSALRPVQLLGGEQTLMAVTADGKVYATGKCNIKGGRCTVLCSQGRHI